MIPTAWKADFKASVDQVNLIARLLKWIIAVDLVICALLYIPDQTREFYRITAVSSLFDSAILVFWMLLIGVTLWFAARQIVVEAESQLVLPVSKASRILIDFSPIVIGVIPILFAALAQLQSIPELPKASGNMMEVGSVIRIQARELAINAKALRWMSGALCLAALTLVAFAWWTAGKTRGLARKLNENYFSKPPTLLVTVAVITLTATLFVESPVALPQSVKLFGIVAIFAICISSFVIHMTLLTDRYRIAFFPIVFMLSATIAAVGLNDNHTVREVRNVDKAANSPVLKDAGDAFVDWLKRPDRLAYVKESAAPNYPVFIVAAQGGGAYAAYNAAVFLARMQDLCPAFRHHLFAVSSVSGGSIGAATFAAALNAEDTAGRTAGLEQSAPQGLCPQISRFLLKERAVKDLGEPGSLEIGVNKVLQSDFLSPLAGALLFPDFTQAFLPFPVPPFDRARALEYALEAAGKDLLGRDATGASRRSLLERGYFEHWDSQRSSPALLFNTTDAGTGKRVVIAPFSLSNSQKFSDEFCLLANSTDTEKAEIVDPNASASTPSVKLTGLPIPLSTAAFISARFPWVSPAATVKISNPCFGKDETIRLVDGGYIDNSGVETALGLVERIRAKVEEARVKDPSIPKVGVHLISLTGGDFPTRSSYSFNDLLEPIRALMSGREARAYIALSRAQTSLGSSKDSTSLSFDRTDLRSTFYRLPLGWSLSPKTRSIIAHESGRYWDCEPELKYTQTKDRSFLSNSDCIQLSVNFLLNGSLSTAVDDLKTAEKYRSEFEPSPGAPPKLDHEELLNCYEEWWDGQQEAAWKANLSTARALIGSLTYQHRYFSFYQAEQVRALLREWDALNESNPNVLAYVLASLSLDTGEFRRIAELLSFDSVSDLNAAWGSRLSKIDEANKLHTPPIPPVDRTTLLNNAKALATLVWQNRFGNKTDADAWKYRARGLVQIVGLEQYNRLKKWTGYDFVVKPDAIWNRRAMAKAAFAHYLNWVNPTIRKNPVDFVRDGKPDWTSARENNTDVQTGNVDKIVARSDMFAGCIKTAMSPHI
jgi:predicted chitinase